MRDFYQPSFGTPALGLRILVYVMVLADPHLHIAILHHLGAVDLRTLTADGTRRIEDAGLAEILV